MTTQEIATQLADLCRKGEFEKAQKDLFAEDATSIEPMESPGFKKEEKGLDRIIAKGHQFMEMVSEVHSIKVSEPLVAGNAIAFTLDMDITMKGRDRSIMSEVCVYEVKDGKISSEHFFM